ncbi:type III pantothenate kinase [Oceanotoga teriensis]|jgi:type III pantothenate kinase|uniref:Type III pantothenate kinase n=1 Tax=Oceanotoga teriensis TaxID=515440 RepID=A0AA45C5Z1_9BACT|nr:type III pantothenate kinase [Oceanotoga teriensis]MDO7977650.1 type III pantothenate kinase [Oceanotoga teriensis]PWJ90061.1 pantothenate kinase [Oceanotoga teriensis]
MELLFDIGNSHTVLGVKNNNNFTTWRIGTKSFETEDELFSIIKILFDNKNIKIDTIKDIGISNVVPSKAYILEKFSKKYFSLDSIFVSPFQNVYNIKYMADYPAQIGADRISNVIASKLEYGQNCITLDFGTAITLDVLKNGNFVGGSITPGFKTSMMALFSNTAQVPQIELNIPDYNYGTNTDDNVQIGIIKTILYGLETLIEKIKEQDSINYKIITTGGMAKNLKTNSYIFKNFDENLTLKGISYYMKYLRGE